MSDTLRPGETLGGLRAVIDSQKGDIEHQRLVIEGYRRELATYRHDPEVVPAPRFEGHAWLGRYSYTGPFHLVPVTMMPYPNEMSRMKLPDIAVPAKKALCGSEWQTAVSWPQATEVCAVCVQRAVRQGVAFHAVPGPSSKDLKPGTIIRHRGTGMVATLNSRKTGDDAYPLSGWWITLDDGGPRPYAGVADSVLDRDWEAVSCTW